MPCFWFSMQELSAQVWIILQLACGSLVARARHMCLCSMLAEMRDWTQQQHADTKKAPLDQLLPSDVTNLLKSGSIWATLTQFDLFTLCLLLEDFIRWNWICAVHLWAERSNAVYHAFSRHFSSSYTDHLSLVHLQHILLSASNPYKHNDSRCLRGALLAEPFHLQITELLQVWGINY